jgi:hypothetical protein
LSARGDYRAVLKEAVALGGRLENGNGPHQKLRMPDGLVLPVRHHAAHPQAARMLRKDLDRWKRGLKHRPA